MYADLRHLSVKRPGRARRPAFAAILAVLSTSIACDVAPPATLAPLPPDIDLTHVARLADLVFDLTDVNQGKLTETDLHNRHGRSFKNVSVTPLPDISLSVIITTDDDNRQHTVAIPGSTQLAHVLLDLSATLVHDDELGIRVHEGFRIAARTIRNAVRDRLHPDYNLTLVGYSLGGATATLLAGYLQRDGHNIEYVLTFGAPKFTNANGAACFDGLPMLRVVSGPDPIPTFPSGNYRQCGRQLILLDGPFVVLLEAGDPRIDELTRSFIRLNDDNVRHHVAYRIRMRSKSVGPVFQVVYAPTAPLPDALIPKR